MKNTLKWSIENFPPSQELETQKILKRLPNARAKLAELKGIASTIPNQNILINTLGMREAKDSSAIENIITTEDDLFKAALEIGLNKTVAAKEVQNYTAAMKRGFELVTQRQLLTNRVILEIQEVLEQNKAGFRKVPGTTLRNAATGEVIYEPPQDAREIEKLMAQLETYINDDSISDYDPIVKMAMIHFQFESIHPFYDGNGRTGRIINILYLIQQGLLDLPILYLSSYIIRNKSQYYKGLQEVRTQQKWENWILYIIEGVEQTANETFQLIKDIREQIMVMKHTIRRRYHFYSQDLINHLFKHPYTKIDFLKDDLKVSRLTAGNYLNTLAKDGILQKEKLGKSNYYINQALFVRLGQP